MCGYHDYGGVCGLVSICGGHSEAGTLGGPANHLLHLRRLFPSPVGVPAAGGVVAGASFIALYSQGGVGVRMIHK